MYKPERGPVSEARMLTIDQACQYTGMGRTSCKTWCKSIGAFRKFGSMARYDKTVIDKALDALEPVQR